MVNYPSAFPQDALLTVLDKVRGKEVSLSELSLAAWNVQGYAMGQFIGSGGVAAAVDDSQNNLTDEQVIELALSNSGESDVKGFLPVPWVLLAKVALNLIIKFAL